MAVFGRGIVRAFRHIAPCILLAVAVPAVAQGRQEQVSPVQVPRAGLAEWRGTYTAEADAGRTRGGSSMSVSLTLVVSPPDRPGQAVLSLEGFQTDEVLICDLDPAGGDLGLLFRSYEDGAVTNRFGVVQYQVGQRLLTLRRAAGQPHSVSTSWQALKPPGKPQDVQFRRKKG